MKHGQVKDEKQLKCRKIICRISKWTNVISQNQLRTDLTSIRCAIGMRALEFVVVFYSTQLTWMCQCLCVYLNVYACVLCVCVHYVSLCYCCFLAMSFTIVWMYIKCRINCDWVLFPIHDHCTVTLRRLKQMYRVKWYEWTGNSINKSQDEIVLCCWIGGCFWL